MRSETDADSEDTAPPPSARCDSRRLLRGSPFAFAADAEDDTADKADKADEEVEEDIEARPPLPWRCISAAAAASAPADPGRVAPIDMEPLAAALR